jgi:predicted membrane chloride channel (bestrophin family)
MQAVLQPEELELLLASKHRPNYVLQILSGLVESSCIVSPERFRMDQNITFFMDAQGSCERILKTPIPLSYTRWAVLVVALLGLGLGLGLVLVLCSCFFFFLFLLFLVLVLVLVITVIIVIVADISGESVMHAALKHTYVSTHDPPAPLYISCNHVVTSITHTHTQVY